MTEPLKIVPAKSDQETTDAIRARLNDALNAVCEIMREGDQAGLQVTFSIGRDQYGKQGVTALTIVRPL
jgi:hypothetical protein